MVGCQWLQPGPLLSLWKAVVLPGLGPGWTRLRLPVTVVYSDGRARRPRPGSAAARAARATGMPRRPPAQGGGRGACGPANRHTGTEAGLAHWQFQWRPHLCGLTRIHDCQGDPEG